MTLESKFKHSAIRAVSVGVALAILAGNAFGLGISGKIRKLNGPVTGPTIENAIVDVDNGAYITNSNSTGDYSISGLSAGPHTLVVKKSGSRSINAQNYVLNADTTFNVCLPESIITTPMGTGILNIDHMNEMYPTSSEYQEGITWDPSTFPRPTFLSNANALDTAAFKRALGAGNGNPLEADTSAVEHKLGIGIFTLTTDSLVAANGGYVIRFGGTSNNTYTVQNGTGSENIRNSVTEINGHGPGIAVMNHECVGIGFNKPYIYGFLSNNNDSTPSWQLEDNTLTSVQIWHRLARNRGEQDAHLMFYSNMNAVAGSPPQATAILNRYSARIASENPFRERISIEYNLPKSENVDVKVYDVLGRLVKRLVKDYEQPGRHLIVWDGKDESGQRVASSIYFINIHNDNGNTSVKVACRK